MFVELFLIFFSLIYLFNNNWKKKLLFLKKTKKKFHLKGEIIQPN